MRVERISRFENLTRLAPEWKDLLKRDPSATPFQKPEWLLPWWESFGSGELFTFQVRVGGKLVALAPMFLHDWLVRRQVTFLGNGVSDYLGFVMDPAFAPDALTRILAAIAAEKGRWELCDLQDLRETSPLCHVALPEPLRSLVRAQYPCMRVQLPQNLEQLEKRGGLGRNLRRYGERLIRLGDVTFETAGSEMFEDALRALIDLHRARWAEQSDASMIEGPAMERFHAQAAANLCREGCARFDVLKLNGAIAAVIYVLLDEQRAYGYLSGFDPSLKRFSPGMLILNYSLEQSIRSGYREFDFLRGNEPYKRDWGATESTTYRLLIWH